MSTERCRARCQPFSRCCPKRSRWWFPDNRSRPNGGRKRRSQFAMYTSGNSRENDRESMSLAIEKSEVIEKHRTHETDTGSPEVQVALMTERVRYLTEHLKQHPKDHHTRLGLLRLVGRRRRLLDYLARRAISRYRSLVEQLSLRR